MKGRKKKRQNPFYQITVSPKLTLTTNNDFIYIISTIVYKYEENK